MCEPATLAMAGLGAVSQYAEAQAHSRQAKAETRAAVRTQQHQMDGLRRRQREVDEDADLDIMERRRQQMRHEGKLRAAFGDAGVLGVSPLREIHGTHMDTAIDSAIVDAQRGRQHEQIRYEAETISQQASQRIASARASLPDAFTTGLKIASGTTQGYITGRHLHRTT